MLMDSGRLNFSEGLGEIAFYRCSYHCLIGPPPALWQGCSLAKMRVTKYHITGMCNFAVNDRVSSGYRAGLKDRFSAK